MCEQILTNHHFLDLQVAAKQKENMKKMKQHKRITKYYFIVKEPNQKNITNL